MYKCKGNLQDIEEMCEECCLIGLRNEGTGKIKSANYLNGKFVWKTYKIENTTINHPPRMAFRLVLKSYLSCTLQEYQNNEPLSKFF